VSRYQKGKANLDFTGARDSEWQWHQLVRMQICTSLQTDNHANTPPLKFFTGRMPFLPPNQQRQSTEGNSNVLAHSSTIPAVMVCLSEADKDTSSTASPEAADAAAAAGTSPVVGDSSHELSLEIVRLRRLLGQRLAVEDERLSSDRVSVDSVLVTMLRYVVLSSSGSRPQFSSDVDNSEIRSLHGAMRRVTDCIEVISNLTQRHQPLLRTLTSPWNDLIPGHNFSSREAFESCRQKFDGGRVANSKGDTGDHQNDYQYRGIDVPYVSEFIANHTQPLDDMLRQYVNRTLETVTKLSQTVQTTLDRMKTLPGELLTANRTAKKIGHKLTEAVSKLNSKVQSGWKQVASKFENVRRKWFGDHETLKKTDKHEKKSKEQKRGDKKRNENADGDGFVRKTKNGDDKFTGKVFRELDGKRHERTNSRRDKLAGKPPVAKSDGSKVKDWNRIERAAALQRKYPVKEESERHSVAGMSRLDDELYEQQQQQTGSWRERVRGIVSHTRRLGDHVYQSIDSADVDNMVEELKMLLRDPERDSDVEQWAWLHCQLDWWHTRRKHRDGEAVLNDCGRRLMAWQLRITCTSTEPQPEYCNDDYTRHLTPSYVHQPQDHRASVHELWDLVINDSLSPDVDNVSVFKHR